MSWLLGNVSCDLLSSSHQPSGWICKVPGELGRHQPVLAWWKVRRRRCRNDMFYSIAGPAIVRPHRSSCLFSPALLTKLFMLQRRHKSVRNLFLLSSKPNASPSISLNTSSIDTPAQSMKCVTKVCAETVGLLF